MRFRANRAEFAEAARWVALAIAPKPTIPALGGLAVHADAAGTVTIIGHDLGTVHQATLAAEVDEAGSAVAAGFMVRDLVAALRGDVVEVSVGDDGLELRAGRSVYRVNTYAEGEWPEFPTSAAEVRGSVDADELARVLGIASPAADDDNPVSRLKGVRLEGAGETLYAIGLRSQSLAIGRATWAGTPFSAAMPIRDLAEAVRGLSGVVEIASGSGVVRLVSSTRAVTLRLFAAGDIDWRSIVPPFGAESIVVESEAIHDAVRRASLTCKADEAVTLTADGDEVKVTAGSQDVADGVEYVEGTGTASASLSFGSAVILGALAATPAGPVTLTFGGAPTMKVQPLHITPDTPDTPDFHHVVMPRKAGAR